MAQIAQCKHYLYTWIPRDGVFKGFGVEGVSVREACRSTMNVWLALRSYCNGYFFIHEDTVE